MDNNKIIKDKKSEYNNLVAEIRHILSDGRNKAAVSVNSILVETYWNIGRHIVEFEQKGSKYAAYGDELLVRLSKDLTLNFGKGFSRSNLTYMRKLYVSFPKCETLSHILTWSHYAESDNQPIGIVLGAYKDKLLMEYATQGIENNLFVSKYQLYLPNKQELEKELQKLLEEDLRGNDIEEATK